MQVPLLDLKAQHAPLRQEIEAAIGRVLDNCQFILGPEVAALEQQIAEYSQAKHCIGVSSGSDALLVSLMALDIGPGDEVITTPYTFFATAGAVARLGAKPVFVDIDPVTYNIDPARIEEKVTARTKAILPVHLYGQCADMQPILDIATQHGLGVIEDAAQAIGAEYRGRRAGSMGTAGCFSFFPSKNLGAFGDGGAVVTNDDDFAEKTRRLRLHGSKPKYHHKVIGGNFRLDAIHAAVLQVKLKHLDTWTSTRQRNARRYDSLFAAAQLAGSLVGLPVIVEDRHIFNQYVVRLPDRDAVKQHLSEQGIGSEIYYPVSMHEQECFSYLGYQPEDLPESHRAAEETLALPCYPEITAEQQQYVVDTIRQYYQSCGQLKELQWVA